MTHFKIHVSMIQSGSNKLEQYDKK